MAFSLLQFKGRDRVDRDNWVSALEDVARGLAPGGSSRPSSLAARTPILDIYDTFDEEQDEDFGHEGEEDGEDQVY